MVQPSDEPDLAFGTRRLAVKREFRIHQKHSPQRYVKEADPTL